MIHQFIEKNLGIMMILIVVTVGFGGAIEIIPLMFQQVTSEPIAGLKPLNGLQLEGRDVYIREGCNVCHSQMIRRLAAEVQRYGHHTVAGELVYNHPFLWGSKRTGPDLARVGGLYSDAWHRTHLRDPRAVVPESNMPAFPWLFDNLIEADLTAAKMRALRSVGVPYQDEEIEAAGESVSGKSEADAMVAYLQQLGLLVPEGS
jgi:cytochrome c oxidase cbb3-type subunit 2